MESSAFITRYHTGSDEAYFTDMFLQVLKLHRSAILRLLGGGGWSHDATCA